MMFISLTKGCVSMADDVITHDIRYKPLFIAGSIYYKSKTFEPPTYLSVAKHEPKAKSDRTESHFNT